MALGPWLCNGWSKTVHLKVKNKDRDGETRIAQSPLQERASSDTGTSHEASPFRGSIPPSIIIFRIMPSAQAPVWGILEPNYSSHMGPDWPVSLNLLLT